MSPRRIQAANWLFYSKLEQEQVECPKPRKERTGRVILVR